MRDNFSFSHTVAVYLTLRKYEKYFVKSTLFFLDRVLMQNEGLPTTQWQMGKTKIFLRGCVHEPLEDKRLNLLKKAATTIQKTWKGQKQRRRFVEVRKATKKIQESFLAWKLRIQFLRKRRAAIVIQAHLRGMFAREVATALREAKRYVFDTVTQN